MSPNLGYLSLVEGPEIPDLQMSLITSGSDERLGGFPVDDVDVGVVSVGHRQHARLVRSGSDVKQIPVS